MKAMVLPGLCDLQKNYHPLELREMPLPQLNSKEILIRVSVCGVCHTELDEIEGRTPPKDFPIILGHQVVGRVTKCGKGVKNFQGGEQVGVAWINATCGNCYFCQHHEENLCPDFQATGRDTNGGYAEYMKIHEDFAHLIPEQLADAQAAPLLCAGAIGYRSFRLTNIKEGQSLGFTGFGASAHLVLKMVRGKYPKSKIYVFARNPKEREFALELGASWAGDTDERSPEKLDAIIDTTPAWKPIVEALANLKPGGRLVINAIRKEDFDQDYLQQLHYPTHLWQEKEIKSVANVERRDVREFLQLAAQTGIFPAVEEFPLEAANEALMELKQSKIRGAKVLRIKEDK